MKKRKKFNLSDLAKILPEMDSEDNGHLKEEIGILLQTVPP